jgi:hypothetical protein
VFTVDDSAMVCVGTVITSPWLCKVTSINNCVKSSSFSLADKVS